MWHTSCCEIFLAFTLFKKENIQTYFCKCKKNCPQCPLRRGRLIPGGLMKDHSRCFSLWKSTSGVTLQHFLPLSVCVCDRPVCLELAVDDRLALKHCRCLWKERVKENRQRKKNEEKQREDRQTKSFIYCKKNKPPSNRQRQWSLLNGQQGATPLVWLKWSQWEKDLASVISLNSYWRKCVFFVKDGPT